MKSLFAHLRLRRTGLALAAGVLATQPLRADTPRHVVLVHGIWDTFRTMRKMERVLKEAGFTTVVVNLTPNGGQCPLDELAAIVDREIRAQIPAVERFSLIGFSMGGLVSRAYMRQYGDPQRIANFISISSPHRGTWTAWFGLYPGMIDMRPGSKFLTAIDADAQRYSHTRWITIRTPFDLMIVPSFSSRLDWAENHAVPVLVHPLMVLDDRILRLVLSSLGAEAASRTLVPEPRASPHAALLPPRSQGTPPPR